MDAARFFAVLEAAGMPPVPREFSVVPRHQLIPRTTIDEMAAFIRLFDTVTRRSAWQDAAVADVASIARLRRSETCFFSAWDFHLPPDGTFQLIEFNDNGSGFLLSAIINAAYCQTACLANDPTIEPPPDYRALTAEIGAMVAQETAEFFGTQPDGMLLVIDDGDSLVGGRFRSEHPLLCDALRRRGWRAALGSAADLSWDGARLRFAKEPVAFVVNRSTDFFWQSEISVPLRHAYEAGTVYVAPNPFSYATRSDKRLLEWLSLPDWDRGVGILPEERALLQAHVPETHVVRPDNLDMLVDRKHEFVFKPWRGYAGRGLLDSAVVGRARLRHLLKTGRAYVAQKYIAKPSIDIAGHRLWSDLRVWAYRGRVFNLSGRASCRPERLDLVPPGGWLPSFAVAT